MPETDCIQKRPTLGIAQAVFEGGLLANCQIFAFYMTIHHALVVLCTVLSLSISGASGTTVIPPTFEEMVDRAELVFIGKVASFRAEWRTVGTDRAIFTLVEFETQEVMKGNAGKTVTLQFLGGTMGDVTLEVAGVPKFRAGDRVILFVEGNGNQICPIVGVFHGKFGLRKDDKTGSEIVLMHHGKPLHDLEEIGNGEGVEFKLSRPSHSVLPEREPMSVEDFKARVRLHLAEKKGR